MIIVHALVPLEMQGRNSAVCCKTAVNPQFSQFAYVGYRDIPHRLIGKYYIPEKLSNLGKSNQKRLLA